MPDLLFQGRYISVLRELLELLRRYLPEDIGALSLKKRSYPFTPDSPARKRPMSTLYGTAPEPNVFYRKYSFRCPEPLDTGAMEDAARQLLGEHDFTSFCSLKRIKKSAVRELRNIRLEHHGEMLRIEFTGSGFLYNMVRILVGTLIEVGRGERLPQDIPCILAAGNRQAAGFTAPAQGLFLWEQSY